MNNVALLLQSLQQMQQNRQAPKGQTDVTPQPSAPPGWEQAPERFDARMAYDPSGQFIRKFFMNGERVSPFSWSANQY